MSITKKQLEELEEARSCGSRKEFHELLEEYTGIVAKPYTANLITERTRNEAEIDRLQDCLKQAEKREKAMTDVVVHDHPEFFGDVISAASKFLKKTKEPVSCEEVAENVDKC